MYNFLSIVLILSTIQVAHVQPNIMDSSNTSGMVIYSQAVAVRILATTKDTLKFNRTESIFTWHLYPKPENYVSRLEKRFPSVAEKEERTPNKQINYYNTATDSLFSRKNMRHLNEVFYIKEKIPHINWDIKEITKQMGGFTVRKATTHFRGREYIAWYTSAIPVPFGPWKLHGLPGLILQAYDQSGDIRFSAEKIIFNNVKDIKPISLSGDEKVLTLAEYKQIMNNFRKHRKRTTLRKASMVVSDEVLANIEVNLPDVKLMETFFEGGNEH